MKNKLWRLARYLHPRTVVEPISRAEMPSLSELMNELSRIANIYDEQTVDND